MQSRFNGHLFHLIVYSSLAAGALIQTQQHHLFLPARPTQIKAPLGDQVCRFNALGRGQSRQVSARTNNILFRSDKVLVVQDGTSRIMVFLRNNGALRNTSLPYCHEQAEVDCGKTLIRTGETNDHNTEGVCTHVGVCAPVLVPGLSVFRSMIGGAVVAHDGPIRRIANIGHGAGAIPLWFSRVFPGIQIESVDASSDVLVASPCFGVSASSKLNLVHMDGLVYLESQADSSYDMIFVDVFNENDIIPSCLKTPAFFRTIARKLAPAGVLTMNVWPRELQKVYSSLLQAFPKNVHLGTSPGLGNLVLLAVAPVDMPKSRSRMQNSVSADLSAASRWAAEAEFELVSEPAIRQRSRGVTQFVDLEGCPKSKSYNSMCSLFGVSITFFGLMNS